MTSLNDCWSLVEAIIPFSLRLLLHGVPGTGKTHAGTCLGLGANKPVYSLTVTEETPAAELRGHFILQGNEYVWMDGPATLAWRTGGRLVINELQRASQDVISILLCYCDDPELARLTLPSGETIQPASGFSVVATMNGNPNEMLDPALRDRFCVNVLIDRVHPKALERLPENYRKAAKASTLTEDESRRISIRSWLTFAELQNSLINRGKVAASDAEQVAAMAVFGPRAQDALNAVKIAAVL